jgi:ABC-type protease/lipase transport system fused ATPase/permease subunit
MTFIRLMASGLGRVLRIVAGLAISGAGVYLLTAGSISVGAILAVVGLVPFLAGAFDLCVLAPLFGCPIPGAKARVCQQASLV